ncbi:uncharacterized protein LOC111404594 [Olea europaea var. sylvestris]|uniref:uncharacterized protein LOC111404594 n=1 Tax=Olea europaea var. sylvestris TaxID=158386 RepID=UPI000C1CE58F|nr:uncharacterized protein LOC111404594 [Olea europaea var. sylvestris]
MGVWSSEDHESSRPSSQCSPLHEPSPLGLRLNKTQSLLELIEKRLSEENSASLTAKSSKNLNSPIQNDARRTITSGANDKLKASNFPASLLRIGIWQVNRQLLHLDMCYAYSGLKSKIEILWSDIIALKATCSDNGPSTLTIVLARTPIFFIETNPQPRKRTIWKPTSDFPGEEASKNRKHFSQCSPDVLNKNYEKLISVTGREFDEVVATQGCSPSIFQDVELVAISQSSPLTFRQNPNPMTARHMSEETSSSSSGTILLIFNVNRTSPVKLIFKVLRGGLNHRCKYEAANEDTPPTHKNFQNIGVIP